MGEMREGSDAKPSFAITMPQGLFVDTPWPKIGEAVKESLDHWQGSLIEIAAQTKQFEGLGLGSMGFQGFFEEYQPRFTELLGSVQQPLDFGTLVAQALPPIPPEVLEEQEEFMRAYRPYHDGGDETLLWEWVERQIGREPEPFLRTRLWFEFRDLGDMTPRETQEVLGPYRGELTRKERERLLGEAAADVRKGFRVYPKHKPALNERVESLKLVFGDQALGERELGERALMELISSALYAVGEGLLLEDELIAKVDYFIEKAAQENTAESISVLPTQLRLLLPAESEDPAAVLEDFEFRNMVLRFSADPSLITGRKRQVLESDLRTGYDTAKAARELKMSPSTVREYRMRYVRDLFEALRAAGF